VALGLEDSSFVQFADGKWELAGPQSLYETLNEAYQRGVGVELLAFAPDDGWYVLFDDGSSTWEGLPRDLHNQLNSRNPKLPGVEALAVGPAGEWFVRYLNGSWRAGGLEAQCSETLDDVKREGHDVTHILFGEQDSWALLYNYR